MADTITPPVGHPASVPVAPGDHRWSTPRAPGSRLSEEPLAPRAAPQTIGPDLLPWLQHKVTPPGDGDPSPG